ncbi:sulfotransferase [Rheinheimera sp.]|uniref:tetratricopeptide repeat-containing sulfotransferase family protein n=1 Tax=Rheinheimera sp. TaxID=1869214 RepID=UPI00307E778B
MLEQALTALKANDMASAQLLLTQALTKPTERHAALRLLVRLSVEQNNLLQAIAYAECLVNEFPEKTDYYFSLSQFYLLDYQLQKNQDLWQEFVHQRSADPNGWFQLAVAARQNRNAELALDALKHWYALTAEHSEFLFQQALICSELLRQEEQAVALLHQLLDIRPGYHAALFNLGHLYEQLGDLSQATACFQAACHSKTDDATSWARWLELAKPSVEDLQHHQPQFELLLSAPANFAQVDLCYALGLCYDRLGLYSQAWQYYQQANQRDRQFLPAYRPEQTQQLMALCRQRQFTQNPQIQTSSLTPIYICGMFRSGSTLAEQILAASGQVACGGELEFLHRQLFPLIGQPQALLKRAAEPEFLKEYLKQVEPILHGRQYFTDKRPENFLYLDVVFQHFPAAKVIWTRRQLADNALSVYFHRLGPGMSYATSLDSIVHYEHQQQALMQHWQHMYPGRIFALDYDELVQQPERVLTALFDFLGLSYNDEAEHFYLQKHAVKTASVSQVRRPLYQHSSGRYLNYQEDILQSGMFPVYCQLLSSLAADHRE